MSGPCVCNSLNLIQRIHQYHQKCWQRKGSTWTISQSHECGTFQDWTSTCMYSVTSLHYWFNPKRFVLNSSHSKGIELYRPKSDTLSLTHLFTRHTDGECLKINLLDSNVSETNGNIWKKTFRHLKCLIFISPKYSWHRAPLLELCLGPGSIRKIDRYPVVMTSRKSRGVSSAFAARYL